MTDATFGPVVTISATYGAAGSVIAPRVAGELRLPFIDRLISADLSQEAASEMRSSEGVTEEEQAASPTGLLLSSSRSTARP